MVQECGGEAPLPAGTLPRLVKPCRVPGACSVLFSAPWAPQPCKEVPAGFKKISAPCVWALYWSRSSTSDVGARFALDFKIGSLSGTEEPTCRHGHRQKLFGFSLGRWNQVHLSGWWCQIWTSCIVLEGVDADKTCGLGTKMWFYAPESCWG